MVRKRIKRGRQSKREIKSTIDKRGRTMDIL